MEKQASSDQLSDNVTTQVEQALAHLGRDDRPLRPYYVLFAVTFVLTLLGMGVEGGGIAYAVDSGIPQKAGVDYGIGVDLIKAGLFFILLFVNIILEQAAERFGSKVDTVVLVLAILTVVYFLLNAVGFSPAALSDAVLAATGDVARARSMDEVVSSIQGLLTSLLPLSVGVVHITMGRMLKALKTIRKTLDARRRMSDLRKMLTEYQVGRALLGVHDDYAAKQREDAPGVVAATLSAEIGRVRAKVRGWINSQKKALPDAVAGLPEGRLEEIETMLAGYTAATILAQLPEPQAAGA